MLRLQMLSTIPLCNAKSYAKVSTLKAVNTNKNSLPPFFPLCCHSYNVVLCKCFASAVFVIRVLFQRHICFFFNALMNLYRKKMGSEIENYDFFPLTVNHLF